MADPAGGARRARRLRTAGVLGILAAVLLGTAPGPAAADAPGRSGQVVLVGVPGLLWEEVSQQTTPHLWDLAADSAIGNMSIRTATSRTCPVDGWLSVSAGERAFSERQQYAICELPVPPEPAGGAGAVVADTADHVAVNAASPYAAQIGLLGDTVHAAGGSTLAAGPGAALAAADSAGRVDRYVAEPEQLDRSAMAGAALTAADLDALADLYLDPPTDPEASGSDDEHATANGAEEPEPDPVQHSTRREALATIDAQVQHIRSELPAGAMLVVAGVSVEAGPSRLNAALLHGPSPGGPGASAGAESAAGTGRVASAAGYLTSESTRRDGLVTLTDTTTTLVREMGAEPPRAMVGRAWATEERPRDLPGAVDGLSEVNTAATVVDSLTAGFFTLLVALQILIYAAAAYAVHRYGRHDRTKRSQVLGVTRAVALGAAAVPVSSYLANLVPWWSMPMPQVALPLCVLLFAAAVVALAVGGPWRRTVLGPMTVVAGVTTAVLFADMCTGAHLQLNSPTGYTPIVAGRFYGLGNIAFAAFATGMLMFVAGLAHALISRGRRRSAVLWAAGIGLATTVVIGTPGLGTDFGGLIAIVPGLTVTVLMIAGARVTLLRLGGVCLAGAAVLALVCYLDYLRPQAEQSHFGLFAEQVVRGEAGAVVARKLGAMLGTLGNWQLTLLAACALVFLFAVLNNPTDWRMGALQRTYEYAPTLRAGVTGSLVTALAGFAANDSGIAIPAIALTVAVPLTLSAALWVLQRDGAEPASRSGPGRTVPGGGPGTGGTGAAGSPGGPGGAGGPGACGGPADGQAPGGAVDGARPAT
ncbi:hypothetical protein [Nocardiopsis coralliicola]